MRTGRGAGASPAVRRRRARQSRAASGLAWQCLLQNGGDPLRAGRYAARRASRRAVRRLHTAERLRRPLRQKNRRRCAGGAVIAPPAAAFAPAAAASTCRQAAIGSGKSAGFSVTSKAAFAFSPSRVGSDMPLVTTPPSSGGRRDDVRARAHAERSEDPSGSRIAQLVTAACRAPARPANGPYWLIHQPLRDALADAHAHGNEAGSIGTPCACSASAVAGAARWRAARRRRG